MKTKTIPFDLETAKKIQAGEIKGKIKTRKGASVRIAAWDMKCRDNAPILALIDCGYDEEAIAVDVYGKEKVGPTESMFDLVLEVPDNEPQFNVGDMVKVRPNDTHSYFVREYDNCIGKIVGTHHEYFVVIVTGAFQEQFLAEELELVEQTAKHEFKPFDKVLVRVVEESAWIPRLFSVSYNNAYIMQDGKRYDFCIPYEGNEHLVGTIDKPKED